MCARVPRTPSWFIAGALRAAALPTLVAGLLLLGPDAAVRRAGATEGGGGGGAEFKRRYDRGVALFKGKQFAAAIPELLAAYRLKPLPRLLFNLGQAHRKLGHGKEAVEYYELYLKLDPELPREEQREVARLIESSRALGDLPSPTVPAPPSSPPPRVVASPAPPPPPPRLMTPLLWAGVGTGSALLGAAVVTGVLALTGAESARGAPYANSADLSAARDPVRGLAISTDVLLGAGALTLGATLIAVLARRNLERGRARAAGLLVVPARAGVALGGSF